MSSIKQWYKLDNAAKIYPPTQTKNWSAMFRLSVSLTEDIDVHILEQALSATLKRFPVFSCKLKSGMFWYYFEQIDGIPPIKEDVKNPMAYLRVRENNGFLFRVRYYKNRLAIEYFHALTDGTGGLSFLLSLVKEYLCIRYKVTIPGNSLVLNCDDFPLKEEYEDAFLKFAREETISRSESAAYHIKGAAIPLHQLLLISGEMPTECLREKAKEYGVSIGVFLTSILLLSLAELQKTERYAHERKQPIKVSVPVNLRNFYPTNTMRNFSSYINAEVDTRLGDYTLEEILILVKSTMSTRLTEKQLNAHFSENVKTEKNILIRIAPLFFKKPLMKFFHYWQGDRCCSSTISNLGLVKLPKEMQPYISRMDFLLGQSIDQRSSCACISNNGNTVINFSRTIDEPMVEKSFFTTLVKLGIPVRVESNGRCI